MSTCKILAPVAALALAGLTAACGPPEVDAPAPPDGEPVDGDVTVVVGESSYEPDAVKITAGNTVTWEWTGSSEAHNVNFEDFHSDTQREGSFSHTFAEPGTYTYFCTIHATMTGVVEVQ